MAQRQPQLVQESDSSLSKDQVIFAFQGQSTGKDTLERTGGRGPLLGPRSEAAGARDTQNAHAIIKDLAAEAAQDGGSPVEPLTGTGKQGRRSRKGALGLDRSKLAGSKGSRTSRTAPRRRRRRKVNPLDRCAAEIPQELLAEIEAELAGATDNGLTEGKPDAS